MLLLETESLTSMTAIEHATAGHEPVCYRSSHEAGGTCRLWTDAL